MPVEMLDLMVIIPTTPLPRMRNLVGFFYA